ncbi:DUF2141 domain-containing protein [Stakelama sp. CBK3Z-3]|uniref:DUF2141 domain-containing protein n=1 Tax=Stakelama flava TaxID=2860338 RepID=A0ABS6XLR9_9SPHN|nr:DUF2141 domain-containing protein [Stakelama flava]MBW4331158.1 DUF2141 domain-containing protein [Stakelama flava]
MIRIAIAAISLCAAVPAMAGDVTVDVRGVKAGQGDLYVALQTRDQFMKQAGAAGTILSRPDSGDHKVVLNNVAPGEYSVAVWHDINGNKQFDREADGRPIDGWAMINGTALHGTPQFDQVKLVVPPGGAAASVTMIYNH